MSAHLRILAIAIAASILAVAAPLRAQGPPRTSSLGWVRLPGAEACVDPRALAQAVEQRLGRAVFVSPAQADVQIEGRIEPAPDAQGFRAHLALTAADGAALGTREIEGRDAVASCRALDDQLALVIALLIDPDAALAPRPQPVAPPRVVVERVFVPVPSPPPAREPWLESMAVGPVFGFGLLPGAGIALSLRGEITPPSLFPFEIGGAVWRDVRVEPAGAAGSTKGAVVSLAYGMIGVCPLVFRSGGTRLRGCAEMELGAARSVGYGFARPSGAGEEQLLVQASLAGRLTQRIVGPLEVGLGLALAAPLRRERVFYVDAAKNEQELFRTSPIVGLVDATIGLTLP